MAPEVTDALDGAHSSREAAPVIDAVPSLFVYGTLQHPPVLRRLLGRVPSMVDATLGGHRAAPLAGRVYPGLVVDPTSRAPGRVLTDVHDDEVATLDVFEGPEYERVDVVVDVTGRPAPCQAWLLSGPSARLVEPGHWSFAGFLLDGVDSFLGGAEPGGVHPGSGS